MTADPLTAFLQSTAMTQPAFAPGSRYHGLPVLAHTRDDGTAVPYVARRFLPDPATLATSGHHVVSVGDRLDNLAQRYNQDPGAWWQIADGHAVLRPADLTDTPGRRLRLTLPAGLAGVPGGPGV